MRYLCPLCNFAMPVRKNEQGERIVCSSCGNSVLVPTGDFDQGRVIGDFVIRAKLGEGAIGAVYKAYQFSLERIVALKILNSKYMTAKGVSEFLREARAAAKLVHTNLVQSYAVGEEDGICYMAMSYINGETLKARIKREGRIPCDEALHIVQQVAEALHYAWKMTGLIHRDVKPDNILLAEHGVVKLTDLGLAISQSEWNAEMEISGSPSYMSPEQFAGEKLDTRSDIYSLGVTLYQMLSGELPFKSETITSLAHQHFEQMPSNLSKTVQGIPAEVNALVQRMMAKVPKKRFKDMDELLRTIWKIRQKTAPSKSMVPDVHTISMRRLDYDKQSLELDSVEKLKQERLTEDLQKQAEDASSGSHWLGLAILFLVVLMGILVGVLSYFQHNEVEMQAKDTHSRLERELAVFATLALDPYLPESKLQSESRRILNELDTSSSSIKTDIFRSFVENLLSLKKEKKLRLDAEQKIEALKLELDEIKRRREEEQQQIITLTAALSEKTEGNLEKDYQIAKLKTAVHDSEEMLARLNKNLATIADPVKKDLSQLIQKHYSSVLCEGISKRRFSECRAVLSQIKEKYAGVSDNWVESVSAIVDTTQAVYEQISSSKNIYAGAFFAGGSKKIISIQNGVVYYSTGAGEFVMKMDIWEIPVEDLIKIVVQSKLEDAVAKEKFSVSLELLYGNFGAAVSVNPQNIVLQEMVDYYALHTAEHYQILNQKLSRKTLEHFRKNFRGTPAYAKALTILKSLCEPEDFQYAQ